MYNQSYFIPGYYSSMAAPSMMRGAMNGSMLRGAGRGLGLFSRIGNGINAVRGLNWGGFINNASKTLGVINQTIPLVRQAGPMFHNMKSMLKVASVFKDETDKKPNRHRGYTASRTTSLNNQNRSNQFVRENTSSDMVEVSEERLDNSPTFFIQS